MSDHTWKETETLLKKLERKSWKHITNKLTVSIDTIKAWALDDSVPKQYYEKIKKETIEDSINDKNL